MKILIAEDEVVTRRVLESALGEWGYEVILAADGLGALDALQMEEFPRIAILDWIMPGLDGLELCRRIRQDPRTRNIYVIFLSVRGSRADVVAGLETGADDYIIKPFDREELRARVNVGVRVLELQQSLASRVRELEEVLARVKQLQGLLPICTYCKKIRDDRNYWQQLEAFISEHSGAYFSHSICPQCYKRLKEELGKVKPGESLDKGAH